MPNLDRSAKQRLLDLAELALLFVFMKMNAQNFDTEWFVWLAAGGVRGLRSLKEV